LQVADIKCLIALTTDFQIMHSKHYGYLFKENIPLQLLPTKTHLVLHGMYVAFTKEMSTERKHVYLECVEAICFFPPPTLGVTGKAKSCRPCD
jgi:hypothetical protein